MNNERLQGIFVACVMIGLVVFSAHRIDTAPVMHDAAQNLLMAINISHHGAISLDAVPPYRPSMYREPAPIAATAAAVTIVDSIFGRSELPGYFSGSRARLIKLQNCLWICLLWLAVFTATRLFTASFPAAVVAASLAVKPLLGDSYINNLSTELPAAVLLIFAALATVRALVRRSIPLIVLGGVGFGLLALTKAAALYVVLVMVLAVLFPQVPSASEARGRLSYSAILLVSSAIIVGPWMWRNFATFGEFQIAERGGLAVYTRALMNQMTAVEYRGAFYVWARPSLQGYLGHLLGFTPQDLELGGRLQKLNEREGSRVDALGIAAEDAGRPDAAISFWRQGRAQREMLELEFAHSGADYPSVVADHAMQADGLRMMIRAPLRDLELVAPLLWRGGPVMSCALIVAFLYAVLSRRYLLSVFLLPGLLLLGIYALLTDFLPRYAVLSQVCAVAAVVIMVVGVWRRWTQQGASEQTPPPDPQPFIP